MQVSLSNYGHAKTKQWNCSQVIIGRLTLYFSYETCIAFQNFNKGLLLSENLWGNTTGKHLNWLGPESARMERSEFERMLDVALNNIN